MSDILNALEKKLVDIEHGAAEVVRERDELRIRVRELEAARDGGDELYDYNRVPPKKQVMYKMMDATAFDAMKTRLAELEDKYRWIPVGKRLPESKKIVPTIVSDQPCDGCWYDAGKKLWFYAVDYRTYDSIRVTHWYDLPVPPKENHV